MTELLYLKDSYQKECEATVTEANENKIVLDKTIFYPSSGGQPNDTGTITADKEYKVTNVKKEQGKIIHELDSAGLKPGDKVQCKIDWEKRYKLMRNHTAAHILSVAFFNETGALVTGNQLDLEKSRFDFELENFDRETMENCVNKANELIKKEMEIKAYELPREEAMKIPGVIKLACALPPSTAILRIVEIGDIDKQADGGTHVKNTKEVGTIKILGFENKGKGRKRVYFSIEP
ncbi:alanyl-tRNA editing protein [Candidatus Woesearchaeota archaeon]|nr:alanyl-tRNA editing protein [Candidatus Woesearchaeota archaeon]